MLSFLQAFLATSEQSVSRFFSVHKPFTKFSSFGQTPVTSDLYDKSIDKEKLFLKYFFFIPAGRSTPAGPPFVIPSTVTKKRMCLGTFLRRVRILAEFFCRMETKFPTRQKKPCVRHSIFRCLPKHTAFLFMTIECSRSVHSIVAAAG